MLQSIPIDETIITAIRAACADLIRPMWHVAVSEARYLRGLNPLRAFAAAFMTPQTRIDTIMAEIELTDRYDPVTGEVWIDLDGTYKINISKYLG